MFQGKIQQLNKTAELTADKPLMKQLLAQGVPVASSCGGDGICGKCVVTIAPTASALPPKDLEQRTLKKIQALSKQRLSCQLYCRGDLSLETSYW